MIAIVLGTRPEIIKLSAVIHECINQKLDFEIVHSNQHYSKEMDSNFFEQLELPKPVINLGVGSGSHAEQTAKILLGIEKYCLERKPQMLIVHGDTNTTLAAALAGKKVHVPIAHVEAGLRSRDETMPEEVNRIITDKLSTLLFAPTEDAVQNLVSEGISTEKIYKTGNTIVDVIHKYTKDTKNIVPLDRVLQNINVNDYILATVHRPVNVDKKERLKKVIQVLEGLASKYNKTVVWPIHPRARKNIDLFSIDIPRNIRLIEPIDYFSMLTLQHKAFVVATDSGGIQEEAYILKKPLITLRDSTERPETLTANFLVDLDLKKSIYAVNAFINNQVKWTDALGTGTASKEIVFRIKKYLGAN